MGQIKVFLSSTCYDLRQIRADLFDFFSNQGFLPVLSEYPNFPINPQKDTIENCIENVKDNTDIFVLVVGDRYGSKIEKGKSITNTEYLYAKKLGIPTYIFICKPIISILPIWKKNKNADFSGSVDSNKIFEFVEELREIESNWCFEFEKAQDIVETLKIQLSHLFKISLDLQKRFKSNLPDFHKKLSSTAINILLNKEDMFEVLFFAQTLEDELSKYEEVKYDLEYQILLSSKNRLVDFIELQKWLQQNLTSLDLFIQSAQSLMSNAFPKFFGQPGVPSDLKGLFYVSNALSRLYYEMIKWSNDIKSTSVDEDFIALRDSFAQYTIKSAEKIWSFPSDIKKSINDGFERLKNGEAGPIKIQTILIMEVDEKYTANFHKEMDKLIRKIN
jgi:hypothetical protein